VRKLVAITVLVGWSAALHATDLPVCPKSLAATLAPAANYPSAAQAEMFGLLGSSYLHVSVEGRVKVEFTVTSSGTVEIPRIVESTYSLKGPQRSSYKPGRFNGFLDLNVLPAIRKWQFPAVKTPCKTGVWFSFKSADA
jgi:hypothetical protein